MATAVIKDRSLGRGIERLLAALDYTPAKKKVVIKPNIVVPAKGDSAVVTSPEVVRHLIRWLYKRGAEDIIIGESPALIADVDKCFEESGFSEMAREEGAALVDLSSLPRRKLPWRYGTLFLPDIVFERTYINVAKMKTHVQTTVSLGIKNQKGLLLPVDKKKFHRLGLHEPIAELSRLIRPELTIIDATFAMDGDGPIWGGRVKLGLLVGGTEPIDVDLACLRIMGINPESVEHLRLLTPEGGYSPEITGDIEQIKRKFKRPNEESRRILKLVSWRTASACTMCTYNAEKALKRILREPRNHIKLGRLIKGALITGVNLVFGRTRFPEKPKGRVILIGNCARIPYEGLDVTKIPGCPPEVEDIVNKL